MRVLLFFIIGCFIWTCLSFVVKIIICSRLAIKKNKHHAFHPLKIILGIFGEFVSVTAAILLYPFGIFDSSVKPQAKLNKKRKGVLLIHGYIHNRSMLIPMKYYLRRRGIENIFDITLSPPFASIEHFAGLISAKVKEIKSCGIEEIDMVCHSMGGIAARYYAVNSPDAGVIGKLITIGSPHLGTALAGLHIGKCCGEMKTGSSFLKDLNEKRLPGNIKMFSIWSTFDNIILPPENSIAPDSKEISFDYIGHIALVFSPSVLNTVYKLL
ncbi:MAG: alpha/beta hydrolase [Candidatus Schekmanbacteria bacterium]|nr:alpha/beta hydrolase [Candidatus Schekmanbacteria bacterium]